jgi:hypothetical protein
VSLFGRQKRDFFGIPNAGALIPIRTGQKTGAVTVTNDSAMRHSAVWACLRLRADLVSTMPLDVYRRVNGMQVEMPKPPILVQPGGERVDMCEWLYSSQVDLDRAGNCHRPDHRGQRAGPAGPDRPAGPVDCSVIIQEGRAQLPHRRHLRAVEGVAREAVHRARSRGRPLTRRVRRLVDR